LPLKPAHLDDEEKPASEGQKEEAAAKGPPGAAQTLYKARTILLFGEINQKQAQSISGQLLAMAHESDDPIKLVINSPGGHVESGDTIHDIIRFIKPRVLALGTGWVASAGAHIFLGANKSDRFCLPNTRFMIHQPAGGVGGPATDIAIEAKEIIKMRGRINETIAKETGQPLDKVAIDTDRNFWMSAKEAKEYGLVSHIIDSIEQFI
jgi:ATP-dependent Clp protease, protease subunit